MTVLATTARRARPSSAPDWLIPLGLLALAFIPIAGGAFRMTTLASHAEITPENVRFFASPIPVVLHIVSVTIFSILGAFQFSPGLRRRWPGWHRAAGRILVGAGLLAALSGLWMAMFYAIVPADNALLHAFRLFFGAAMATSIVLGFLAIRRRQRLRAPGLDAPRLCHRYRCWHAGCYADAPGDDLRQARPYAPGAGDGRRLDTQSGGR